MLAATDRPPPELLAATAALQSLSDLVRRSGDSQLETDREPAHNLLLG